jgi:DME family drug/metabolite transporter
MEETTTARLQILLAALLFSTGGAAIKSCSLQGWQIASFRSGVAALTLIVLARGAARRWCSPPALAVGAVYAACMTLFVLSNKFTTAANTIFLQSTAPLWLLMLSPWLLREPIRRKDLAFMAALGAGLVILLADVQQPGARSSNPSLGNILAACSGVCWALTVVGLRRLSRSEASGTAGAGAAVIAGNVIACVAGLPMALPLHGASANDWAIVVFLGVFQIGLAYVALTAAIRRVPAFDAALLLLLEPVLNPIWAWLVHGEMPGRASWIGGTILVAGTLWKAFRP